jgi:glycosyltransferase involved in cell wall biosynthesis
MLILSRWNANQPDKTICFVRWAGREDAASGVRLIRTPLAPRFLEGEISPRPAPAIVAVGRWNAAQKNAPLLASALQEYLSHAPETRVTLIRAGGETVFAPLIQKYTTVSYLGRIPHLVIAEYMKNARFMMFSSRWEGLPVASLEMVALGGTIVGPGDLPNMLSYTKEDFGTVSAASTPVSLAEAMCTEMAAWESGKRNPQEIASVWRQRLAPDTLTGQILSFIREVRPV